MKELKLANEILEELEIEDVYYSIETDDSSYVEYYDKKNNGEKFIFMVGPAKPKEIKEYFIEEIRAIRRNEEKENQWK